MQIGVLNKAEYEWVQHEGEFLKAGGTREQLDALRKGQAASGGDPKLFDDAERATMALTQEMTQKIDVSPATMKRVRSVCRTPRSWSWWYHRRIQHGVPLRGGDRRRGGGAGAACAGARK